MTKDDLKLGNILKLRNGALCCIYPSKRRSINDEAKLINILNGDLENDLYELDDKLNDRCDSDLDIVTVYKDYTLKKVLWERKEINLTDAERVILSNIDKFYKYIARDKDGTLHIFAGKVKKVDNKNMPWWSQQEYKYIDLLAFRHLFNFIKWEDEEPYLISDLLKEDPQQ